MDLGDNLLRSNPHFLCRVYKMNHNSFLWSEFFILTIAGVFVLSLWVYFHTGNKIMLFWEIVWFCVLIGFAWYGAYRKLEDEKKTK